MSFLKTKILEIQAFETNRSARFAKCSRVNIQAPRIYENIMNFPSRTFGGRACKRQRKDLQRFRKLVEARPHGCNADCKFETKENLSSSSQSLIEVFVAVRNSNSDAVATCKILVVLKMIRNGVDSWLKPFTTQNPCTSQK